MTPISAIAVSLRNGKSVKQSSDAAGLPITRIETIADWEVNPERVGYADLTEAENMEWLLEPGDILISHINSTKHLGKCAIYEGQPSQLIHGMNLLALRVDRRAAVPSYAYKMLASPEFRKQLPRITKHSVNQSSFNISNFKKLEIPLPPLPEQKRIAAILDAADNLRAKRRESLAQLDTLLQSTFLEMFGDPVTNPMGWDVSTLGEECKEIKNGLSVKQDSGASGIPISRIETISEGVVNPKKVGFAGLEAEGMDKHLLLPGDILFSHINSTEHLCKCAIFRKEHGRMVHGMNLLRFRPGPQTEALYLLYLFKSDRYRASLMKHENRAVNQSSIAAGKLKLHPLPVPPLDLQHHFATIVESIERQKIRLRAHLAELDTLFASLQSRAFNGEL